MQIDKPIIKAIETVYNGYRFRSRLEARWAVFFDAMGITYEYEKEGYDLGEDGFYLPDFELTNKVQDMTIFVEIKGQKPSEKKIFKCCLLAEETKRFVYVFIGDPWEHTLYWIHPNPIESPRGHFSTSAFQDERSKLMYLLYIAWFLGTPREKLVNIKRAALKARQARFEYGENPSFEIIKNNRQARRVNK